MALVAPQARVSVIIPTYNRAELVVRAISSVLAQTVPIHQVIVIDDGSTDATLDLVKTYADRIDIISLEENVGVSAARNRGLLSATGDWIAFLDSDDLWLPQKIEKQLSLVANQSFAVVHCDELWIRDGKQLDQLSKHQKAGGDQFKRCLERCIISPSAALVHRHVFESIGLFDEQLLACEDYDFWIRCCDTYQVGFVDSPLIIKFGGHADQLSHAYWGMDRMRVFALEKYLRLCTDESFAKKSIGSFKKANESHISTTVSSKSRKQMEFILTDDNRIDRIELAYRTMMERLDYLAKGARKRKNSELIRLCEEKVEKWANFLEFSVPPLPIDSSALINCVALDDRSDRSFPTDHRSIMKSDKLSRPQPSKKSIVLCLVVAHYGEARSLIEAMKLRACNSRGSTRMLFRTYQGELSLTDVSNSKAERVRVLLVISGSGPINAALATIWLSNFLSDADRSTDVFWINYGSCGHPEFGLGTPVIASSIYCENSRRLYYPEHDAGMDARRCRVNCRSIYQVGYPEEGAVDMESSGFWHAAELIAPLERISCIKVVTDNEVNPLRAFADEKQGKNSVRRLQRAQVSQVIEQMSLNTSWFIEQCRKKVVWLFSLSVESRSTREIAFGTLSISDMLKQRFHFTVTQSRELATLLNDCDRMRMPMPSFSSAINAASVLRCIRAELVEKWDENGYIV